LSAKSPRCNSRLSRLGWFILLYVASAAAFAVFVYGLRALIPR
jgi:hypothetical protein